QLRALVPHGSIVLGEAEFWFAFSDGGFVSDLTLSNSWPRPAASPETAETWIRQVLTNRHVDYVFLDGEFGSSWAGEGRVLAPDLHQAFEQWLQDNCQELGAVELPFYGVERAGPAPKRTTVWHCGPLSPPT